MTAALQKALRSAPAETVASLLQPSPALRDLAGRIGPHVS